MEFRKKRGTPRMEEKHMKKRALFLMTVLLVLLAALTVTASAATVASGNCGANGGNLTWTLDDSGTLTISGTGAMADYGSQNSPWYSSQTSITKAVIQSGVTTIGEEAFYGCDGLTSVTIPDSVTAIGESAFWYCHGLTSVTIPNSVTTIGSYAFSRCTALTSVTINGNAAISSNAFRNCTALTTLKLGSGATEMDSDLLNISTLTTITVDSGNSTYSAKNGVLLSKDGKTLVKCPRGKTGTFTVPSGVTTIGDYAFRYCDGLTSVTISNSVTVIGNYAFYNCDGLTTVAIPKGVATIGSSAFESCTGLTAVTIPNSVTAIGGSAFSNCDGLTSVAIPSSVTEIGSSAFEGCTGLTSVTIPNSVTDIGAGAFSDCTGLTSVTINGNAIVDWYAFNNCSALTTLTVNGNPVFLGWAFDGCTALTTLKLGSGATEVDSYLLNMDTLTTITVDSGNSTYSVKNGVLLSKDGKTLVKCPRGKTGTFTVPSGVTTIGDYAFRYCDGLTSVTISNSVTVIGDYAFDDCSGLTSVTVPNSVTGLGSYAFRDCTALESVSLPNSITAINSYTFEGCTALKSVTIPNSVTTIGRYAFEECTGLTSVTIPNSVSTISVYAFRDCTGLKTLSIGSGVRDMGNYAFSGCTGLTTLRLADGVYEIGSDAFQNCTSLTSVTIPDSVRFIYGYAFDGCTALEEVNLSDGVVYIYEYAFRNCTALKEIALPDSLYYVDDYTFSGCTALESATIGSVSSVGISAFDNCTALSRVSFTGSLGSVGESAFRYCGITELALPENVTAIDAHAFRFCADLTKVYLPAGMETLGSYAFADTGLTDLYFGGTSAQWAALLATGSDQLPAGVKVHYNCGAPGKITAHPADVTAPGGTAVFTVTAEGEGVTYQWQVSANGGKTWNPTALTGNKTASLKVPVIDTNNGRQYRCVITDGNGMCTYSAAATLYKRTPLAINTQPTEQKKASGYVYFTVGAQGDSLKYQWQWSADGKSWGNTTLSGYNTNKLRVGVSTATNGRSYRCVITDSHGGTLTSEAAKLTKVAAPKITAQPKDQIAPKGYVYFTVGASGDGLTYQWQYKTATGAKFANTTLTGYNTDTLRVMSTAANDGRQYCCVITDAYGQTVTSNAATLYKRTPLSIDVQPEDQEIPDGQFASFSVDATGDGLTYQWQYKTATGAGFANTTLTGATTETLTVRATATTNNRQYRCIVTDRYGNTETSDAATLTLDLAALSVSTPDDQSGELGEFVYFTVDVEYAGDREALTYRWLWSDDGEDWYETTLTGHDTGSLRVRVSATTDERLYRCEVTDPYGQTETSDYAQLTVWKPELSVDGAYFDLVNGKAYFTVEVEYEGDYEDLEFQWQYSLNGTKWSDTALTGYDTEELTVSNVSACTGRMYRCVVTDTYGAEECSSPATLTVE